MKPHPGIDALKEDMPYLLSGSDYIDDETMEMIARVVWRKAIEWHDAHKQLEPPE